MDRLSALPRELIALICSVNSAPNCAVSLWKCGSRALQTKISQGITVLELYNEDRDFHGTPPKFLSKLPFLRELSIIRKGASFAYPDKAVRVLLMLSPTIESLTIDSNYGAMSLYHKLSRDSPFVRCEYNEPNETTNRFFGKLTAFPKLHTFNIIGTANYAPVSLNSLPLTLTKLCVPLPNGSGMIGASVTQVRYLLESLPPKLLDLEIFLSHEESPEFLSSLPPKLTRFKFESYWLGEYITHRLVDTLPKSLLSLELHSILWNKNLPAALPPLLEDFLCLIEEIGDEEIEGPYEKIQPSDFARFPATIQELNFNLPSQQISGPLIHHLPQSIARFTIQSMKMDGLKPNHWPQNLVSLTLYECISAEPISLGSILPASLLHLNILSPDSSFTEESDYHLPSGLEVLTLKVRSISLPEILPPRLNYLDITLVSSPHDAPRAIKPVFHSLPSTLAHLAVQLDRERHFMPISSLPPLLKSLRVSDLSHDLLNDPFDRLERARYLRQIGRTRARIDEGDDPFNSEADVCIFDLLPRSITLLTAKGGDFSSLEPKLWARLPPHLTALEYNKGDLPDAVKEYIPKKFMLE